MENRPLSDIPDIISCSEGELNYLNTFDMSTTNVDIINKRFSRDLKIKKYGRNLIDLCKSSRFRIMNGRLGNIQNTGDYTCYKENGASVVDYLICKPHCMHLIEEFVILPKREVSDHRPLKFILTCTVNINKHNMELSGDNVIKCKWDVLTLDSYKCMLEDNACQEIQNQLLVDIIDPNVHVDNISDCFYKLLDTAIKGSFSSNGKSHISGDIKSKFPNNKWFNQECKNMKNLINKYARNYDISRHPFSEVYHRMMMEYNRVKQKYKRQYQDKIRYKIGKFSL